MKKRSLLAFVLLMSLIHGWAQNTDSPRRFFPSLGITVLFEGMYETAVRDTMISYVNPNTSDTIIQYDPNGAITLISVTYDPRFNLYDFNDQMSLSANFPVEFSFSAWESDGLLAFVVPAMLDFNYGCHSTYNNIDRWGGHIGIGYQMATGPLLFRRPYDHLYYQPVIRAGVKGPLRKNKNCYIDLYWGFGRFYNNVQPNFTPGDYKTAPSKLYAKIVFGWLLNYD